MPYLKKFIAAIWIFACVLACAQEVIPPPFKPNVGMGIPSASIQANTSKLEHPPSNPAQPQEATLPPAFVGRVFSFTGEWTNAAGQILAIGSGLAAGEKISVKSGGKSSISIILTSASVFQRTCPDAP